MPSATASAAARPGRSTSTTCCCARWRCSRTTSAVRAPGSERFPYLLVDEYQDTNRAQYELVRLLAGPGGNLTRGRRRGPVDLLLARAPTSRTSWTSSTTSRARACSGSRRTTAPARRILDAAAALVVAQRAAQGQDALRAVKGSGRAGRALRGRATSSRRRPGSSESIAALRRERARRAVLFRMNAQSRLFEEGAAAPARMPYLVVGGVGFYERKEVKDVLAYLRLVAQPRRRRRLPARRERAAARHRGQDASRRSTASPRSAALSAVGAPAARLVDEAALPARALVPLRRFRETLETLRQEASGRAAACAAARPARARPRGHRLRRGALAREDSPGEPGPAREPRRAPRPPPSTTRRARRRRAWPASSTGRRWSPTTDRVRRRRAGACS